MTIIVAGVNRGHCWRTRGHCCHSLVMRTKCSGQTQWVTNHCQSPGNKSYWDTKVNEDSPALDLFGLMGGKCMHTLGMNGWGEERDQYVWHALSGRVWKQTALGYKVECVMPACVWCRRLHFTLLPWQLVCGNGPIHVVKHKPNLKYRTILFLCRLWILAFSFFLACSPTECFNPFYLVALACIWTNRQNLSIGCRSPGENC